VDELSVPAAELPSSPPARGKVPSFSSTPKATGPVLGLFDARWLPASDVSRCRFLDEVDSEPVVGVVGEAGSLGLNRNGSWGGPACLEIGPIPISHVSHGLPGKEVVTGLPSTINLGMCFPLQTAPSSMWILLAQWRGRESVRRTAMSLETFVKPVQSFLGSPAWEIMKVSLSEERSN
jgi:hypothetical protein